MGDEVKGLLLWFNNRKFKYLIGLFLYWLIINYFVLHAPLSFFDVPTVSPIEKTYALKSLATSPSELSNDNWFSQLLPDDWSKRNHEAEQIWYRSVVDIVDIGNQTWAIYLPSVTHNAAVFVNNIWVGQGGQFDEPVSRYHNKPLLFKFPPEILNTGTNVIDVRVKSTVHDQGLLGQFYIAPSLLLEPSYSFKSFVRVDLIVWLTISMFLMALVVFAFWYARPQDAIYGIFSLELFFWAIHNLNLFVSNIPISTQLWESISLVTFGWTIIAMVFFNHRYAGGTVKWVEKLLLIVAGSYLLIFLLPDTSSVLFAGFRLWNSFLLLVGSYAIFHLLKLYWQEQNKDVFLMLLVGIPIIVFGLHDYLMLNHFIDRQDGLIIQYSVIPASALFSWFMIRRFVFSINEAENLTENLEQRIEENKIEIKQQYEKLAGMEKQSVLSEERERIMRDMHDGIGGQLISVISMLQSRKEPIFKKVVEKVQYSLTDLRFVIDSLDPLHQELPTLLGMMRYRLSDQLEAADIKLEWAVTDLPELPNMSPRRSLHTMRIVQEAITNSIKHSESKKMTLSTGVIGKETRSVFVDIIDYGKGFDLSAISSSDFGRGVKNMQYRANQMDAVLDLDSSLSGTRVRLLIELV